MRELAGAAEIGDRVAVLRGLQEMVGDELRLRLDDLGQLARERRGDAAVIAAARAAQQRLVGHVLDEPVLEHVAGPGRRMAAADEVACPRGGRARLELAVVQLGDRPQQLERSLAAHDREHLRDGARLAEPSSRASSDSRSVEGTSRSGSEADVTSRLDASSIHPDSSTACVISSTKSGTPSVRAPISASTSAGSARPPVSSPTIACMASRPRRSSASVTDVCAMPHGGTKSARCVSSSISRGTGSAPK